MNVPPQYNRQQAAYRAGWAACIANLRTANRAVPPVPRTHLQLCAPCHQPLEIGQPAVSIGQDAYGHHVWAHVECPTTTTTTPPRPPIVMARVAALRAALDEQSPGAGMAVLDALRSPHGPTGHTLATTRPDGSTHLTFIDLDTDR